MLFISKRILGFGEGQLNVGGKSVNVRPHEPAEIDPDAQRVAVELQRNATTKVKL
jgi:hypothetical protein